MSRLERLAIFGATGSIGDSTLKLVRLHPERYQIHALTGFRQLDKLLSLCVEFRPQVVGIADELDSAAVQAFAARLTAAGLDCQLLTGQAGLDAIAGDAQVDTVVAAIVGAAGLSSTLCAVQAGKKILLANKEALVMAGDLVMRSARNSGATILPIDSEHNAIFQCLPASVQTDNTRIHDADKGIDKLWLTASGGAFLHKSMDEMRAASVADAVAHPNWSMGQKISVDSSTMMNKGLELIEACHLFNLPEARIDIVIHPQSIIHSMVAYTDGSVLAQLGTPDMCTPIAHALAYPARIASGVRALNLMELSALEFIAPDVHKFPCLRLAREAARLGNGAAIILNASNEVAVAAFLAGEIRLTDVARVVERTLYHDELAAQLTQCFDSLDAILSLDGILSLDKQARALAAAAVAALNTEFKTTPTVTNSTQGAVL